MALGLRYIIEGPGELDVMLSVLRSAEVCFTFSQNLGHPQCTTNTEERGEKKVQQCILKLCEHFEETDEGRFALQEREDILGFGEIFLIEASRCFLSPVHRFRAYYSLNRKKGMTIWMEDGTGRGREVFINA